MVVVRVVIMAGVENNKLIYFLPKSYGSLVTELNVVKIKNKLIIDPGSTRILGVPENKVTSYFKQIKHVYIHHIFFS